MNEARKVCKDAAKILHQPEKDVLHLLKKMQMMQFEIIDDTDIPLVCPVMIQKEHVIERCRNNCVLGTGKCLKHQEESIPSDDLENIKKLTLIAQHPDMNEKLWCNEETREILNAKGVVVGELTEENGLILYCLENTE